MARSKLDRCGIWRCSVTYRSSKHLLTHLSHFIRQAFVERSEAAAKHGVRIPFLFITTTRSSRSAYFSSVRLLSPSPFARLLVSLSRVEIFSVASANAFEVRSSCKDDGHCQHCADKQTSVLDPTYLRPEIHLFDPQLHIAALCGFQILTKFYRLRFKIHRFAFPNLALGLRFLQSTIGFLRK